ncbi:MAG: D-alanine--D-alanine ligase [Nitrospirae bacterium]|nr:D-alanine--D-alanine ligase [Nitrospirota bacterium]
MITGKRIGVLMGGISSERDISLKTGNLVASALKRLGYDVTPVDMGYDLPSRIEEEGIEAAFIALHGRYGEDGCVQGLLEILGIPYTGSGIAASAICMDKLLSKKMFEYYGIPTPEYSVYEQPHPHLNPLPEGEENSRPFKGRVREGMGLFSDEPVMSEALTKDNENPPLFSRGGMGGLFSGEQGIDPNSIKYPVVVKPCREGSTIGISIVSKPEGLQEALDKAIEYGDKVIIEKYISGIEVTAGILDNKPLPLVEINPIGGFYDFTTKTSKGMADYIVPARLSASVTESIKDIALKTHLSLGCCYVSRVDFRVDPAGNPYVLEVNTVPGMTETSLLPMAAKAAGIGYDELVEMILSSAFIKK